MLGVKYNALLKVYTTKCAILNAILYLLITPFFISMPNQPIEVVFQYFNHFQSRLVKCLKQSIFVPGKWVCTRCLEEDLKKDAESKCSNRNGSISGGVWLMFAS